MAEELKTVIALASQEAPELFILDIGMLGMDSCDLGVALKREHPNAAFIGNSAWNRDAKRELAAGFSFDYFVRKPTHKSKRGNANVTPFIHTIS